MNNIPDEKDFEIVSQVMKLCEVTERNPRAFAEGRAKFLAEAQTYPLPVSRHPERRHIEWKNIFSRKGHPKMATLSTLLVIFSLLFGGTGATVVAAQSSLPNQLLYGVKLASEDVRTGLTRNNQNRLDLVTNFADVRLDEILQLVAQGKSISSSVWDRLVAQYDLALSTAALSDDIQLNRDLLQIQARIAVNLEKLAGLSGNSQYNSAALQTLTALQNDLQLIASGLQDPGAFRQYMGMDQHNQGWQTTPSVPSVSGTPISTLQSRTPMWRATDNYGGYMMTPWPNSTTYPQSPMMTPVPGNNMHNNDPWMGSPTQVPNNQWHDGGMWGGSSGGMGGGMGGGLH